MRKARATTSASSFVGCSSTRLFHRARVPYAAKACRYKRTKSGCIDSVLIMPILPQRPVKAEIPGGMTPYLFAALLLPALQIVIHGAFRHAEGLRDFPHGEPLRAQGARACWGPLGRPPPAPLIHSTLLGQGNPSGLALLGVLL